MTKRTIFIIGIMVLAAIYESVKGLIGNMVLFGSVVVYVVSLRVLAEKFGK
jgi:uncharacterized membrane protein YkgB